MTNGQEYDLGKTKQFYNDDDDDYDDDGDGLVSLQDLKTADTDGSFIIKREQTNIS